MTHEVSWRAPAAVLLACALAACSSTPRHTNVLVFGTNTRLAVDVSQDPTGSVGATIGYKRQEAVWMPLLPNAGANGTGDLVPTACADKDNCPMFVGNDGSDNDTYSVLASFGATATGAADGTKEVRAQGQIAQYFATGLAARALAVRGGAGLVNTNGGVSADVQAAVDGIVKSNKAERAELLALVADAANPGKVSAAQVTKAFSKEPGSKVTGSRQARIKATASLAELEALLVDYDHGAVTKRMLDTLNAQ